MAAAERPMETAAAVEAVEADGEDVPGGRGEKEKDVEASFWSRNT